LYERVKVLSIASHD